MVSGYEIDEKIQKFFGREHVGTNSSCPLCGASIEWNWSSADNMNLHIDWHEKILFWERLNE